MIPSTRHANRATLLWVGMWLAWLCLFINPALGASCGSALPATHAHAVAVALHATRSHGTNAPGEFSMAAPGSGKACCEGCDDHCGGAGHTCSCASLCGGALALTGVRAWTAPPPLSMHWPQGVATAPTTFIGPPLRPPAA